MLARVLFVLLAGVPVCRGPKGANGDSYSEYYDADRDVQNIDLYESYNNEIKSPQTMTTVMDTTTLLKRRNLDIIDVKEVLNNILQGKRPGSSRGRRTVRDYTFYYDSLENSINGQSESNTDQGPVIKNWQRSVEVQKLSPTVDEQQYLDESSRQAIEQHWSYVYQPETSTYSKNDIIADVRNLLPMRDEEVPKRSSTWRPTQDDQPSSTTDETEATEDTVMQESPTTTYSNSDMQAAVRKLVQHWSSSSSLNQETSSYNIAAMRTDVRKLIQHWSLRGNVPHQNPNSNVQHQSLTTDVQNLGLSMVKGEIIDRQTEVSKLDPWSHNLDHKHWSVDNVQRHIPSDNVQLWTPTIDVQQYPIVTDSEENLMQESKTTYSNSDMQAEIKKLVQHWTLSRSLNQETSSYNNAAMRNTDVRQLVQHWSPRENIQHQSPSTSVQHQSPSTSVQHQSPSTTVQHQSLMSTVWFRASQPEPQLDGAERGLRAPTTAVPTTVSDGAVTTVTCPTTQSTQKMDIDAIMAIISNLTYDYEWNLTDQFNKSIIDHGVPTCSWEKWGPGGAWTASTDTTLFSWDFENTSVVTKCFVCGLTTTEIPRNAHCADAFAGDFLPLMPIDAQSRGKIATFRKYCRYLDTPNYIENPDDPRAIYGRFTGGCAVRWTDLTGVYTQRTCRSKFRPLMGQHLASKRMAKLELALVNVDEGCIISPMATLLPVSRGISLYARFHACVCKSNWCNRAALEQASFNTLVTIVLAYWLVYYP